MTRTQCAAVIWALSLAICEAFQSHDGSIAEAIEILGGMIGMCFFIEA
jgi:hypothetical protein